jgi:hypothetical protein
MRLLFQNELIVKDHYNYVLNMIEQEPAARNIVFYNSLGKKVNYMLSFPYLQLATIRPEKSKAGGMIFAAINKKPYHPKTNGNCCILPLPNSYTNFSICGITAENHNELADKFWNSLFHLGGYDGEKALLKSSMKTIPLWAKMTKIAPAFILDEGTDFGSKPKNFYDTICKSAYYY